jgi:2-polyprenyl-6-methoxyphenol hydroxylase-like FAD-dependent oxidoreductase
MEVAIVGGGIAGLSLALNLHQRGISCHVYERATEITELGVGITLLPHAMREFAALGLQEEIVAAGIENLESCFFNRFGQLIYKEARGRHANYRFPEIGLHRGRLHLILYRAALSQMGPQRILTSRQCVGVEQDEGEVRVLLKETATGQPLPPVRADVAIACDGINSAIRKQFYPREELAFAGINTWRGVTVRKPILTGRSYLRIGSINTGKLVVYPIIDNADGQGNQMINWMAEIQGRGDVTRNDWNKEGDLNDVLAIYRDWHFQWLDVAEMLRQASFVLEYPMVDRDPVSRWTFGRVTLAGDAAHPMYPRGSNGAAQGAIDARTLAEMLARYDGDPVRALHAYEEQRRDVTARIVSTNRSNPPDFINIKVEQLVGDRPFDNLDRYISQDELRALSDQYKRIAGFGLDDIGAR